MPDNPDRVITALRGANALLETRLAAAEKSLAKVRDAAKRTDPARALDAMRIERDRAVRERDQAREQATDLQRRLSATQGAPAELAPVGDREAVRSQLKQRLAVSNAQRDDARRLATRLIERLKLVYRVGTLGDELAGEVTKALPRGWRDLDTGLLVARHPGACAAVGRVFLEWCRRRYLARLGWDDKAEPEVPGDLRQLVREGLLTVEQYRQQLARIFDVGNEESGAAAGGGEWKR